MIYSPWSKANRQCVHFSTLEVCWHKSQKGDEEGRIISAYWALISRNRVETGREEGPPEAGQVVGARGREHLPGRLWGAFGREEPVSSRPQQRHFCCPHAVGTCLWNNHFLASPQRVFLSCQKSSDSPLRPAGPSPRGSPCLPSRL